HTKPDARTVIVSAAALDEPVHITLRLAVIAHSLEVETLTPMGVTPPTFYVGLTQTPITTGSINLTKPDPHGMTWVDAWGGPEPDLFFSRGAVRGELVPPAPGKYDRFLAWTDGRYELISREVMPSTYGRGRQAAWFNLDGQGPNELFVGNM